MASVQGDLRTAAGLVEVGRTLAAQTNEALLRALIDAADGTLALHSGDLPNACSHLQAALTEFGGRGERTLEVGTLYPLGLAFGLSGLTRQAVDCHERVLAMTEEYGEKMFRSLSLWALAIAVWRQHDSDRAAQLIEESLNLARQVHSPRVATSCLEALAWITGDLGSLSRATVLMGAAEGVARSIGSTAVIHSNLSVYHQECEQNAQRELGSRAFAAAYRHGQVLGFDAAIAYALHEQPPGASAPATGMSIPLTKRERQVTTLIAEGLTNREIAERLVISPRTAQGHVEHILSKLGFTSRTQVASWAVEQDPNIIAGQ